ncbi:MAG: hypothetical protein ACFE0I_21720 [Elainellaceae cyanobacterium]
MPIGTYDIKPEERPVIIVATPLKVEELAKKDLSQLLNPKAASEAIWNVSKAAKDAFESMSEENPLEAVWNVSKAAKDAFESMPEEHSLAVLEELLDLNHQLHWYKPSEARKLFKFDIGHTPENGEILVQHPVAKDLYLIPTKYSARIAKEKESAFIRIAASLGAKELRLISAEVKERRGRWGSSFPVSQAAAQIGISADYDKSGRVLESTYSRFGKPNSLPKVPAELQGWVDSNPDLKAMVHGRLHANLELHRVTLEFSERTGIGGEIAVKIFDKGLSSKSRHEQLVHSVWEFEVEYWPKE